MKILKHSMMSIENTWILLFIVYTYKTTEISSYKISITYFYGKFISLHQLNIKKKLIHTSR